MGIRSNASKLLLETVGAWLPLKRHLFGKTSNAIRVLFARGICSKVGKYCTIECGAHINTGATLLDYATVGIDAVIGSGTVIHGPNMMGPGVKIYTRNHRYNPETHHFCGSTKDEPVHIGQCTWIGTNVIILPGVTIGDHTIIGAGSVVTKSIPPGVMAAGNPCVVKRILDPAFAPPELAEKLARANSEKG